MDMMEKFKEASKLHPDGDYFFEIDGAIAELLLELGDHYSKMELDRNNDPEFTKRWKKVRKLVKYSKGTIKGIQTQRRLK